MLTLSCMGAGWDTNVWGNVYTNGWTEPVGTNIHYRYYWDASTNKVYVKHVLFDQAAAAINERADLFNRAGISTSRFFRTNRGLLASVKSRISILCATYAAPDFMNTGTNLADAASVGSVGDSGTADCSDTGSSSLNRTNGYKFHTRTAFGRYNTTKIMDELGLTNTYFSFTPWRKLQDPDNPHGWHHIDDILNLMDRSEVVFHPTGSGRWISKGEDNVKDWNPPGASCDWTNDWNGAISLSSTNVTVSSSDNIAPHSYTIGQYAFGSVPGGGRCRYRVFYNSAYSYPRITTPALKNSLVTLYARAIEPQILNGSITISGSGRWVHGTNTTGGVYTNNNISTFPTNTGQYVVQVWTNVSGVFTGSTAIGDSSLALPVICDQPDETSLYEYSGSGDCAFSDTMTFHESKGVRFPIKNDTTFMSQFAIRDFGSSLITNGFTYYAD